MQMVPVVKSAQMETFARSIFYSKCSEQGDILSSLLFSVALECHYGGRSTSGGGKEEGHTACQLLIYIDNVDLSIHGCTGLCWALATFSVS
jgi:hypothetical protein